MSISGFVRENDYVAAQFLHMKPRPLFAAVGIILLLLATAVLFLSSSLPLLISLVVLLLLFGLYIPWRTKKNYRQYKALSETVEIEIREEGLHFSGENGASLVPWSHILKWRHNNRLVLIYPASNLFHMVPSHFFNSTSSYSDFIEILNKHVGVAT